MIYDSGFRVRGPPPPPSMVWSNFLVLPFLQETILRNPWNSYVTIVKYNESADRSTKKAHPLPQGRGLEVEWIGKENEVDWIGVEEKKGDW